MGIEISLCMIVKNEEAALDDCLSSSADLADEIIIVDTGSTDRTVEIAKKYTDKIYHFEWINDFSAARNYSFSLAAKDYIFWLDADDVISEENREKIKKLKETLDPAVDCVLMRYDYETNKNGKVVDTQLRERIVKRSAGLRWKLPIHETIDFFSSNYITADITIKHNRIDSKDAASPRNFLILEQYFKNGGSDLKLMCYYGADLYRRGRVQESKQWLERYFASGGGTQTTALDAVNLLISIYADSGEQDKALEMAGAYLPHFGDKSEFLCTLGTLYKVHLDDLEEAVFWFNRALSCPLDPNALSVEAKCYYYVPHSELAHCYLLQGNYHGALANYEKALEYDDSNIKIKEMVEKIRKAIGYF